MNRIYVRLLVAALGALLALPTAASAAAPATSLVEGVLTSSGGSAAADGDYDITFSIYDAQSSGTQLWTEGPVKVKVTGGRFSHALGSSTAIDAGKLAAAKGQWLTLKVGSDPELPAQPLHSTIFALHALSADKLSCDGCVAGDQIANGSLAAAKMGFNFAGSSTKGGPALDVACTACVGVSELKFDGDVDLGGNSLKAANGTFSGDVSAKTVTATSFVGDGSKLTGLKTPAGECKNAGEVVKGINADGSLKCVAALDPAALPKDGLNEISNDLISNQFVDTIAGTGDVAIPDNTGAEANSELNFPDIGISQDFELTVEISNTDLSTLALTVLPPDDKKTGWTLCDPCGDKDAKSYKKTFDSKNLPKSGDLAAWIGANPKGLWNLKALDTNFCVPQAPGNATICDVNGKTDGKIVKWSIKIQTLSNKKIAINGDIYLSGKIYSGNVGNAGVIYKRACTWRWASTTWQISKSSCTPPACASGHTDLGVSERVNATSNDYDPWHAWHGASTGVSERNCLIPPSERATVYETSCSWVNSCYNCNGAQALSMSTCTPPACASGHVDLGTQNIITSMSMNTMYSQAHDHNTIGGNVVRICEIKAP